MSRLTRFRGGTIHDNAVRKSAAYTVVVNTDSGKTFVTNTTMVFTLPSIAVGEVYEFIYDGEDGAGQLSVSPAALDGITYVGDATDDKDIINTLATAKHGDRITVASLDGVVSWQITDAKGVWAKEA